MLQDPLKTIPLFSNLSHAQRNRIQSGCRHLAIPKNAVILHQKEHSLDLCVILSGRVKVSLIHEDGREVVLDLLTEGDFFGELSLFDLEPRSATVTAMTDAKILVLTRDAFLKIVKEDPGVLRSLLSVMVKRLRKADERIETLTFLDVKGRVAKLLMDLAHRSGERLPNGSVKIRCPSHQDIAGQIGSSREAVTKALKSINFQGLIALRGKEVTIAPKQFESL